MYVGKCTHRFCINQGLWQYKVAQSIHSTKKGLNNGKCFFFLKRPGDCQTRPLAEHQWHHCTTLVAQAEERHHDEAVLADTSRDMQQISTDHESIRVGQFVEFRGSW